MLESTRIGSAATPQGAVADPDSIELRGRRRSDRRVVAPVVRLQPSDLLIAGSDPGLNRAFSHARGRALIVRRNIWVIVASLLVGLPLGGAGASPDREASA